MLNTSNETLANILAHILDFPEVALEKILEIALMPVVIVCKFFYLFFKGVPYSQWDAHRPTNFWRVGRCILVHDKKSPIAFHKWFLIRLTGKPPLTQADEKKVVQALDLRLDN